MNFLQDEYWKEERNNVWEFKLKGYPWLRGGTDADMVKVRVLLLRMVERLETHGWGFYSITNLYMGGGGLNSDNDSWFCVKDRQWVPGMPVFHL
jgi:hypothetical protein